ncbi:MAG: hypothetical protein ACYC3X_06055 [Pirellulaceae bacterium]
MDQVKRALAVLKKWHFWILCGVIVVLYAGTWFLSTSNMTKATESRVAAIGSAYSTGQRISGIQNHPNPASADMMKQLNRAEAEQVQLAWNYRFREQEDVLVWPTELLPDFIAAVEPLKPIESKVDFPTPPKQELKMEFRNRYRDYIRKELPKLAEIIGAEWRVGQQSSGNGGGMGLDTGMGMGMGGSSGYPGMGSSGGMRPPGMGPPSGMVSGGMVSGGMVSGGMVSGGMVSGGMGPGGMGPPGGMRSGSMGPGMSSGGRGPGMGMGMGANSGAGMELLTAEGKPIVVEWSSSNQAALQATSMNWTSPTTLQVLYAQEDLWVLRSLMLVIKATNGDADAQYNAAVKEILSIDLGATAPGIKMAGRVSTGGSQGGMGSSGMMGSMMMPGSLSAPGSLSTGGVSSSGPSTGSGGASSASSSGSMGMGMGMGPGMGPGMAGGTDVDPANGRYVDDKNEPLAGDRLRTAIKSEQPADAFIAVAKRMPMRMRVRMNVLKLPLLLCEFAQSDLPVEVRQVRINTAAATGGGAMGGSGYGGGGPPPLSGGGASGMSPPPGMGGSGSAGGMGAGGMMTGMTGGMMSGMGRSMGSPGMGGLGGDGGSGGQQVGALNTESPYDASVEIYGIIYIYNPVDPAKLGIEAAANATDAPANAGGGAAPDSADAKATDNVSAGNAGDAPAADAGAAPATAPAAAGEGATPPAAEGSVAPAPEGPAVAPAPEGPAVVPATEGTVAPAAEGTAAPVTPAETTPPASDGKVPAASSAE